MPLYDYKCKCGNEFSDVKKIAERRVPCEEKCPECGEQGGIDIIVSTARIVSGVGDFRAKTSNNFRDRLKEIKKMAGKTSTIDV